VTRLFPHNPVHYGLSRRLQTAPHSYISEITLASGGARGSDKATGTRAGGKFNDKDANFASGSNVVGFRNRIGQNEFKGLRASEGIESEIVEPRTRNFEQAGRRSFSLGAVPIISGGKVIGAVGCGGGTGEQDHLRA
jgi:hypothetical protein